MLQDGGFPTSAWWYEYKFVANDGLGKDFFKALDKACAADSTHWSLMEESLEGEKIYRYFILPHEQPVDRSKGMCDRMVADEYGNLSPDWDGEFISVKVQEDTVVLRDGWLR